MKEPIPRPFLTVASPPHHHAGKSVAGYALCTILALVPAAVMAVVRFGMPAARVIALSCVVAVVVEVLSQKAMERESTVHNLTPLITGLTFAFLLPAMAPWWLVAAGSAMSVVLGKMIFGGMGGNPVCPAVVGWTLCRISWKDVMDVDVSMLNSQFTYPLSQLKLLGIEAVNQHTWMELFLGQQLGGLGAAQVAALLAGGIFLLLTGYLRWYVPAGFLAGVAVTAWLFNMADPAIYPPVLFQLLTGSVFLAAFFLAPDPGSSPGSPLPMLLYGITGGVLVIIIRVYGIYPDGVPFAVLLANFTAPLFERIRPRPFGGR